MSRRAAGEWTGAEARLSALVPPAFAGVWRDVFAGGHDEYWLRGGRGSGKSTFAATVLVALLLRDERANAIVYRKVQATLRESVYAQILWVIERLGLEGHFEARLSPLEIRRRGTGQRVLFRGTDDPAKSKSIKLRRGYFACLWFEELSEFEGMDELRTVRASVLRGGGHAVTICTFNPPMSARSWVNIEARRVVKGRMGHRSSYLEMPREWLGDAFLAQAEGLREQNEAAYRHMFLGEAVGAGGQVFGNVRLEKADGCAARRYYGLDFGFAGDPDALVCCAFERKAGRLWILDEVVRRGMSIGELAREVKARVGGGVVTCDCADPRMIAELRARGILAVGARKGPDSVMHGIRFLQGLREIVIDPERCPVAAQEFSTAEYRRDREGDGYLPMVEDRDNHTLDAVRYALEGESGRREAMMR